MIRNIVRLGVACHLTPILTIHTGSIATAEISHFPSTSWARCKTNAQGVAAGESMMATNVRDIRGNPMLPWPLSHSGSFPSKLFRCFAHDV